MAATHIPSDGDAVLKPQLPRLCCADVTSSVISRGCGLTVNIDQSWQTFTSLSSLKSKQPKFSDRKTTLIYFRAGEWLHLTVNIRRKREGSSQFDSLFGRSSGGGTVFMSYLETKPLKTCLNKAVRYWSRVLFFSFHWFKSLP